MLSQQYRTSAIIVGAGPAGAAASIFLSKNKVSHIVIDKDNFPRDKVCGDACSGRTSQVIECADPSWLDEIRANEADFLPNWGMSIIAPNGKSIDIPYTSAEKIRQQAKGFTVPRLVLDNYLFGKMDSQYCTFLGNTSNLKINRVTGGVSAVGNYNGSSFQIDAPIIVGADGDKSLVRKQMSDQSVGKAKAVGLRSYYHGVKNLHPDNYIELHFLPQLPSGYLWIFPLTGGRANVGIGMLSETIRSRRINLRELFLHVLATDSRFSQRFKDAGILSKVEGWGIPIFEKRMPISGDSFILTGDAAQLVDPFSGEGIGNALYSGMLAAAAVTEALSKDTFTTSFFKQHYDIPVFKALGKELEQNARLQKLFNNPVLFNALFNKAHKSRSLMSLFKQALVQPPSIGSLLNPTFLINVLLNR